MKNDRYEFTAIFQYGEDGISISFPDLPGALTCADTTEEGIKNAEEVLGLVLYDMECDEKEIPIPTPFEKIQTNENEKSVMIKVWMPLVRNELDEQAVKKNLTIPQWLNRMAEAENVNFSKLLQGALKEYLKIDRVK